MKNPSIEWWNSMWPDWHLWVLQSDILVCLDLEKKKSLFPLLSTPHHVWCNFFVKYLNKQLDSHDDHRDIHPEMAGYITNLSDYGLSLLSHLWEGNMSKDETVFSLAKDKHNQDFLFSCDLNYHQCLDTQGSVGPVSMCCAPSTPLNSPSFEECI